MGFKHQYANVKFEYCEALKFFTRFTARKIIYVQDRGKDIQQLCNIMFLLFMNINKITLKTCTTSGYISHLSVKMHTDTFFSQHWLLKNSTLARACSKYTNSMGYIQCSSWVQIIYTGELFASGDDCVWTISM